jgi:uncharacterized lipoprotein YmbA
MVRRVLLVDLDDRLPASMTLVESNAASSASLEISLDIIRFDPDATGVVRLDARWELLARTGGLVAVPHNAMIVERVLAWKLRRSPPP